MKSNILALDVDSEESDRLPPHSDELERAVLSCAMQSAITVVSECLSRFKCGEEVFYDLRHKTIYRTICCMVNEGHAVDSVTFYQRVLKDGNLGNVGGLEYINKLPDTVPSAANFSYYADELAEVFMQRKTLAACTEAASQVYASKDTNEIISAIESKFELIRELRSNDIVVKGDQATKLLSLNLQSRMELRGRKSGVVTHLEKLDKITDGLQYGEQTIIGARPSQGKSALATTIIRNACIVDRVPTLVITLEMSIEALCRRILSNHSKIPMQQLRDGTFPESEVRKCVVFGDTLSKSPIFFSDAISGSDCGKICHTIRRMANNHGVRLVVIDYLQKIHCTKTHEKRTYEVAEVSGALKAVAVESGVALLTLAQLNREPEQQKGRQPRLSDLADSGQIERDGDCIMLLERNRAEGLGHQAKLHVAKQRDGETGVVELHFDGRFCVFENTIGEER